MAGWNVDLLLLRLGDARHLATRRLSQVTTRAGGVETTTLTSTIVTPTTVVVFKTVLVTVDFVTTITFSRDSHDRP